MPRNIKQVTHDLTPIMNTICDLGQDTSDLLHNLYEALIESINDQEREYFETLISAIESLNASSDLAKQYIQEVDAEADQAGITKSY